MLFSLLLSLVGYYLFYCSVMRKNPVFFPLIFISSVTCAVYLFGLMEIIDYGIYFVTGAGVLLLIPDLLCIIRRIKQTEEADLRQNLVKLSRELFLNNTVIFMLLNCVWIYFLMKGTAPSHCDDFTHWYRICKIMHADRALPSSPDLRFQYYPPGTAVWIYYLTKFIPFSASNCFRAQSLLNASCIVTLMSIIPEKASHKMRAAGFVCVCIAGVILCAMNTTTYSLLVDGTLGLVPMSAVVMILMDQNSDWIQLLMLTPAACLTALIKNSGLLFVLFIAAAWIIFSKEKLSGKSDDSAHGQGSGHALAGRARFLQAVVLTAVPILMFKLYQSRAARIYGNKGYGKHEVSLSRYLRVFNSHEQGQNLDIIRNFLSQVFLVQKGCSQLRMLWIALIAAAGFFLLRDYRSRARNVEKCLIVYLTFCNILYMVGLMLTYLFSMGKNEASGSTLACFFRYTGTCTIFISGLVFLYFGHSAFQVGKKAFKLAIFGLVCSVLLIGTSLFDTGYIWGFEHYSGEEQYTSRLWELLEEYVPENREYSPYNYVIVWNPDDFENDLTDVKIHFAVMTYMRADNVSKIKINRFKNNALKDEDIENLKEADYLILLGDFHDYYDRITEYVPVKELSPGLNKMR